MPLIPNPRVPRPEQLPPSVLATLVADIQEILWKESRVNPDDRRDYLDYWNPHKEWDDDELEEIATLLDEAGLRPSEDMTFQVWSENVPAERDSVAHPAPSGERGYLLGLPIEDAVNDDDDWPDERWTIASPESNPSNPNPEDMP